MAYTGKFFRIIFGQNGDNTPIPDPVQGSGQVSMDQGFGPDYELDPDTDPDAKDVPRDKSNWLYGVITAAIQWFQKGNVAQWIDATTNGGVAFSYTRNSVVRYDGDGEIYLSLVDANTATPGTDRTKWRLLNSDTGLYAGNPNGNVASNKTGQTVFDTTHGLMWVATTVGPASGGGRAQWSPCVAQPVCTIGGQTIPGNGSQVILATNPIIGMFMVGGDDGNNSSWNYLVPFRQFIPNLGKYGSISGPSQPTVDFQSVPGTGNFAITINGGGPWNVSVTLLGQQNNPF